MHRTSYLQTVVGPVALIPLWCIELSKYLKQSSRKQKEKKRSNLDIRPLQDILRSARANATEWS